MRINAQGGELVLRNEHGDTIIVPRERRKEAMKALLKDDHRAIDSLALQLPKAESYAAGGTVMKGEDPVEGMMGPETTITAKRPEKSIGNFFQRWGHEHSENPTFGKDSFLGAIGSMVTSAALLPQAAITYALDPKGNVTPAKALQQNGITDKMNKFASNNTNALGAMVSLLANPNVQNTVLDPLLASNEIAKGVSKGAELANSIGRTALVAGDNLGAKYLPNAHKLNPKAFKPNVDAYYRGLGKTGLEDAIEMGYLRSNKMGKFGDDLYLSSSFKEADYYSNNRIPWTILDDGSIVDDMSRASGIDTGKYFAEIPKKSVNAKPYHINDTQYITNETISLDKVRFLKEDWLKGYKQIEVPNQINSSVDDVVQPITPKPWQMQELPGLHLKSTMEGEAISKIIEPKTGLINTEQALAIIGKESGGADKVALIRQGLGDNIPKKMNYNDFRKTVQDQLIPLERQFSEQASNYGVGRLGYPSPKRSSYEKAIEHNEHMIEHYKKQIAAGSDNSSLKGDLQNAINNLENSKKELATLPLENQTLILGNKSKFGRGSSAHGNPEATLGHAHFLRDAETPDVLTVTQIQSDAFQGTHRIMPKNAPDAVALERQQKSLQRMEEIQERNKSVLNKMKTEGVDEAGLPVQDYQIKQFEDIVKAQEQTNLFKKAHIENFTQKQLLDKNHQERYLQELVDYAGKRGDINKVRVPTSETAAKIQGYSKQVQTGDNTPGFAQLQEDLSIAVRTSNEQEVNRLMKLHDEMLNTPYKSYSSEHQTILKKYKDNPKIIKKLFGEEPKVVTDSKGNTWYEFDIPKKFKEGKGEIKALSTLGATLGVKQIIDNNKQQ